MTSGAILASSRIVSAKVRLSHSARLRGSFRAAESSALGGAVDGTDAESLAGFDAEGAVGGDGFSVERDGHVRAGEGDNGGGVEAERRAVDGEFEGGGGVGVTDEAVGEAEGQVVHRAGGRDADIPVADPAGVILDGGLRAAFEDFDGGGD